MAAGLGFKTFNTGDVLTASEVNGYLMQGILVFADATARDAAITSPQEGQFAFTKDNNSLWYYSGSAWVASGATGDIEGVTAGTGISGGGTSGTVTITNSMATAIDAKGDLVVGTGADTFSRLAVGTNGHTLVADSAETTGLKWAAPSSGAMTKITSGSFASSTNIIDGIFTTSYKVYKVFLYNLKGDSASNDFQMRFRVNIRGSIITVGSSAYFGSGFEYSNGNSQSGFGYSGATQATIANNIGTLSGMYEFTFSRVGNGDEKPVFRCDFYTGSGYSAGIAAGTQVSEFNWTPTGLVFLASSGNVEANFAVYGLEN